MKRFALVSIFGVGLLMTCQAMATNGYFSHGYGPISKSLAGACVAITSSAMCSANNPAIIARMDNQWEIGASLFSPDRGFKANDNFR